LTKCVRKVSQR